MRIRLDVLLLSGSLLAACGGSDVEPQAPTAAPQTAPVEATPAEANRGEGEPHEHKFPPAVGAFHDSLAPLWHSDPGADRKAKTCEAIATLSEKAGTMTATVPEGADADAWQERGSGVSAAVEALGATCGDADTAAFDAKFKALHDAFHAAIEILPGGHQH